MIFFNMLEHKYLFGVFFLDYKIKDFLAFRPFIFGPKFMTSNITEQITGRERKISKMECIIITIIALKANCYYFILKFLCAYSEGLYYCLSNVYQLIVLLSVFEVVHVRVANGFYTILV